MTLPAFIVSLIVVGVLLWLVNTYVPMDGKISGILNAVVMAGVVVWLLYGTGVLGDSGDIRLPEPK